jgi:hypothetical protein
MNNLVNTLKDLSQLDEAVKIKQEVLEKRRRILSEEHPSMISAINNLITNTLRDLGQLDKAAKMLEVTVQKMKKILGDRHPHTKVAIRNLTRFQSTITHKESMRVLGKGNEENALRSNNNGLFLSKGSQ